MELSYAALNQSEGVFQASINLLQDGGRKPSKTTHNLVPGYGGEGLTIDDAVEPEVS